MASSSGIDYDPQEGSSTSKTIVDSKLSDKYIWSGNPGNHGVSYDKDVALTLFVAASLEDHKLRLATEMKQAGKFDDAVLILDDLREVWFFQAKHSQDSSAEIKLNDLFPEILDGKKPFALPMYIQSYMDILCVSEFKDYAKRLFIFSNKALAERQLLEELVDIKTCSLDRKLERSIFAGCWDSITSKDEKMDHLLEKMNIELFAVKNAIMKLLEEGKVLDILVKYKTPIQTVLQLSGNYLRFSECSEDGSKNWLFKELRQHFTWNQEGEIEPPSGRVLNYKVTDPIKKIFSGSSRDKYLPRLVEEGELRNFMNSLIICSEQPDNLFSVRDKSIKTFIDKWIHLKERGMFTDRIKLHKIFENEFIDWHQVTKFDRNEKFYLGSEAGIKCVDVLKAEMRNSLQKLSPVDFHNYVERHLGIKDASKESWINEKEFIARLEEPSGSNRCYVLVGEPGIGKTTFLKRITCLLQEDIQKHVYLIYLNKLITSCEPTNQDDTFKAFRNTLSESSMHFLKGSLKNHSTQCFILLDGFDEIDGSYQSSAIEIIKEAFCKNDVKVFISGRNHVKEALENCFSAKAINLIPLEKDEQMQFLRKYWNIDERNGTDKLKFNTYALRLLKTLHTNINSKTFQFTGLPLIIQMLAEVYREKFDEFQSSTNENIDEAFGMTNTFGSLSLFESFIKKSFNILVQKWQKLDGYSSADSDIPQFFEQNCKQIDFEHQLAAIEQLNIEELQNIVHDQHSAVFMQYMQRNENKGEKSLLINITNNNRFEFVHLSYAEYFVAKYLYENLSDCKNVLIDILNFQNVIQKFFFAMIEEHFDDSFVQITTLDKMCERDSYIMYLACLEGKEKILKQLLKHHSAKTIYKRTFLSEHLGTLMHAAVKSGCENLVSLLLTEYHFCDCVHHNRCSESAKTTEKEINLNTLDGYERTPIHEAARYGYISIIELLWKHGANIHSKNKDGETALHKAALNGHLEVVKLLIDKYSFNVNVLDNFGRTPLHAAALGEKPKMVKLLIENYSANVNASDIHGQTPLHLAALVGWLEVVKLLIDKSADVTALDRFGRTPLYKAAFCGKLETVKLLLEYDSTIVNAPNKNGQTPLHIAAFEGHLDVMKLLIAEYSADMDAPDKNGDTPRNMLARKRKLKTLERMLENM